MLFLHEIGCCEYDLGDVHPSSIWAFLHLGSWGHNNLILYEDVLAVVKANSKRKYELSDSDGDIVEVVG